MIASNSATDCFMAVGVVSTALAIMPSVFPPLRLESIRLNKSVEIEYFSADNIYRRKELVKENARLIKNLDGVSGGRRSLRHAAKVRRVRVCSEPSERSSQTLCSFRCAPLVGGNRA